MDEMLCSFCGRDADRRPVPIYSICCKCWFKEYGREQAVRQWKAKHWWRRLCP